jgi:hypothetical protein
MQTLQVYKSDSKNHEVQSDLHPRSEYGLRPQTLRVPSSRLILTKILSFLLTLLMATTTESKKLSGAFFGRDDGEIQKELEWGVKFDVITIYRPIKNVGFKYINTHGKQLQLVTEFFNCGDLSEIAAGKCDFAVRKVAQDIKAAGHEVWIRMFHEFNYSNTYPWCLYPYSDKKIKDFKAAWRRVVGIYHEEKAPVKFQLCYMGTNPHGDKMPFSAFYPGDNVVDQVCVDVYVNSGSKLVSLKSRLNDGIYPQLVKFGKPIVIGEVSCTDKGLDKGKWMEDAWHTLKNDFPAIKTVNFFLVNKGGGREWGLNSPEQVQGFVRGLKYFNSGNKIEES